VYLAEMRAEATTDGIMRHPKAREMHNEQRQVVIGLRDTTNSCTIILDGLRVAGVAEQLPRLHGSDN
jgi:hypothetical protein